MAKTPDDIQNEQIAALQQAVGTGQGRLQELEKRFGGGEARITALEQRYAADLARIEPVLARVEELSSAAVAFNRRLNTVEEAVAALQASSGGSVDQERLTTVERRLAEFDGRLENVEIVRTRGSGLSDRLASIEAALDKITHPPTEGVKP